MLADMHVAGQSYAGTLENPRGPRWWREAAREVLPFLDEPRAARCSRPSSRSSPAPLRPTCRAARCTPTCSATTCCSTGTRIGGVIDFYFAGVDAWLFDVAVTLNDWCMRGRRHARPAARGRVPRRLSRGAPVHRGRARRVAGDAARRGAALLAVAAPRLPPAAAAASWCTRTIRSTSAASSSCGFATRSRLPGWRDGRRPGAPTAGCGSRAGSRSSAARRSAGWRCR